MPQGEFCQVLNFVHAYGIEDVMPVDGEVAPWFIRMIG
jgi:hypothetical protein